MENLLRKEQVAFLIGVSGKTLDSWYAFKRVCPDSELAQILPEYIQNHPRQVRYWKEGDLWKLIEFRKSIPHGRNGVMGIINNRRKDKKHG